MPEEKIPTTKNNSLEWLLRGALTRIGDTFDRLTGRRWTPSSSLATSELSEKLKKLLDLEAKELPGKGKFVPHNIKLKMQWDKFSTDAEDSIKRLENELMIAAIDHINDNRYHTYAPLTLLITPDYFTEGVKLLVGFEKFGDENGEVAINVTVPQIKVGDYLPAIEALPEVSVEEVNDVVILTFEVKGKPQRAELNFKLKDRRSIGRTPENAVSIEDQSVSKMHAALVLNADRTLLVADTGSTNGTFVNGQRIVYGQALPVNDGDRLKFGDIEAIVEKIASVEEEVPVPKVDPVDSNAPTVAFELDEFSPTVSTEVPETESSAEVGETSPPETRFMELKPIRPPDQHEVSPAKEEKPASVTEDRINYDFPDEEKK